MSLKNKQKLLDNFYRALDAFDNVLAESDQNNYLVEAIGAAVLNKIFEQHQKVRTSTNFGEIIFNSLSPNKSQIMFVPESGKQVYIMTNDRTPNGFVINIE